MERVRSNRRSHIPNKLLALLCFNIKIASEREQVDSSENLFSFGGMSQQVRDIRQVLRGRKVIGSSKKTRQNSRERTDGCL
uniref:Secreted protein n=1 Tax=Bursaphelenchus xylophilus TaxID=6326 RepID=A0A1I7S386_BURXY